MITVTLAGKELHPISVTWSMGLDEDNPTTVAVSLDSSELDFVNDSKGQDIVITVDKFAIGFVLTGVSLDYDGGWSLVLEGSGARWLLDRIPKNVIRSDVTFSELAKQLADEHNVTVNSDIKIEARYKKVIQSGQTDYHHLKQEANRHGVDIVDLGKTINLKSTPSPVVPSSYSVLIDTSAGFSYQDLAQTKDSGIGAEPAIASSNPVKRSTVDPKSGKVSQPLKSLKSPIGKSNLVALGRELQAKGYRVSEHPSFGGVNPVHKGRGHYDGRAIDVNVGFGNPSNEKERLDALRAELGRSSGYMILWRVAGHFDHMHIEVPIGKSRSNPGVGRIAPNIEQADVSALLDTNNHKEFKGLTATISIENDVDALKLIPSQVITTKCNVIKSLNRVWIISGINHRYEETLYTTINLFAPQRELTATEGDS